MKIYLRNGLLPEVLCFFLFLSSFAVLSQLLWACYYEYSWKVFLFLYDSSLYKLVRMFITPCIRSHIVYSVYCLSFSQHEQEKPHLIANFFDLFANPFTATRKSNKLRHEWGFQFFYNHHLMFIMLFDPTTFLYKNILEFKKGLSHQ